MPGIPHSFKLNMVFSLPLSLSSLPMLKRKGAHGDTPCAEHQLLTDFHGQGVLLWDSTDLVYQVIAEALESERHRLKL